MSLMIMALTPFIARMLNINFDTWLQRRVKDKESKQIQMSSKTGPIVTTFVALTLIISASIDHRSLVFMTPKKIFGVEATQLNQLVGYLDENLPAGNMYNEYALGGYLLYALTPPPKVFIDGRADMYGEQILSDYNTIKSSNSKRGELLKQYDVDWVVFEKNSELIADLEKTGHWQSAFTNDHYAVLTRTDL
jgi:hypothetical protein